MRERERERESERERNVLQERDELKPTKFQWMTKIFSNDQEKNNA